MVNLRTSKSFTTFWVLFNTFINNLERGVTNKVAIFRDNDTESIEVS